MLPSSLNLLLCSFYHCLPTLLGGRILLRLRHLCLLDGAAPLLDLCRHAGVEEKSCFVKGTVYVDVGLTIRRGTRSQEEVDTPEDL